MGRFDVWAPLAERVRLSVGDEVVEMTRGDDGWWLPAGSGTGRRGRLRLPARRRRGGAPRPAVQAPARRCPRALPHGRHRGVRLDRRRVDRASARRSGRLRAARRDLHPRGHPRRRARTARPPHGDRRRPRRADAGERLQRHPQLGLRRGRLVRRRRDVRRAGGVPALRRRLPRRRARRGPGRGLQPPRPVRELPAALRALPQGGRQHLGRPGQPRRRAVARRCGATSSTTR